MQRINFSMVFRVMGWLLLIEAVFMLVPTVVALCDGEQGAAEAFGIGTAATALCGLLMAVCSRPRHSDMGRREGFLLTASVWIVFSLFGMIPYMLAPSTHLCLSAAFFEAMSGFTTTGASLVESTDLLSHAVHVWRCLSQWIGGMGIILFTLAVLPMLNSAGGTQMFHAEVTGITHDKVHPRISSTAKRLWGVYLALTASLFLLLWAGPMNAFEAICHAMATVSTGGFSTSSQGIDHWNSTYIKVVITIYMFLCGVNFALIYRAACRNFKSLWENETFMTYCRAIAGVTFLYICFVFINDGFREWDDLLINPLFQVVSFITSAGYTLNNFSNWGVGPVALAIGLMFMGGCAGSTSGGAKIDRAICVFKFLRGELRRVLRPNSVTAVRMNGRTVSEELVHKTVAFLCVYFAVIAVGALALCALNVPIFDSFFSAFSCVNNCGLDASIDGNGAEYLTQPDAGWWILSLLMLIGRLEIFTVLTLFSRTFWHR
jgi:trk system potassium uptake protein TrkH